MRDVEYSILSYSMCFIDRNNYYNLPFMDKGNK